LFQVCKIFEREMKMRKTALSERMYKLLAEHIAEIDREKGPILKSLFSENAATAMQSEAFFREYIDRLESFLKNAEVRETGTDSCPFSIIGSIVQIRDLEDSEVLSCRIVLPYAGKSANGVFNASCLSPMGQALLLSPIGSIVTVRTPAGQIKYEIMSISVDDLDIGECDLSYYINRPKDVLAD
jgi:transcription elongation factor GreA